jgi:hypothetical protein
MLDMKASITPHTLCADLPTEFEILSTMLAPLDSSKSPTINIFEDYFIIAAVNSLRMTVLRLLSHQDLWFETCWDTRESRQMSRYFYKVVGMVRFLYSTYEMTGNTLRIV